MTALVGYTGFVGSNIYAAAADEIEAVYNSENIKKAYGSGPDLLIYAGLRAEKYLANADPEKDREQTLQAEENIRKINPGKLILISTIDVFKNPQNVDETSLIETRGLHAYGYNRYQLECRIREHYPEALIVRLPGLFGKNIKKNFIYDYLNRIPFTLKRDLFKELTEKDPEIEKYYVLQDNGFYRVNVFKTEQSSLKERFRRLGFSALNFTDSRSRYQFYNLSNLWRDLQMALDAGIRLWHPATEPVSAGELYEYLSGKTFTNELNGAPANYDYRTVYSEMFGGNRGYIQNKNQVMDEIKIFVQQEKH